MEKLLWVDLEMTGLNVDKERIIEAAAIVTDLNLNELDTYHAIVKQPQSFLDAMDDWNQEHHGKSGLLAQIPSGKEPDVVERELLTLVEKHFPAERAVLAGNSIGQDKLFLDRYFLKLSERLHYRILDVTSWKVIFENAFSLKFEKQDKHRALDDIRESIAELRFYMSHIKIV